MTLRLYNTQTRRKAPFRPYDPACVRVYLCGPTVYGGAHIGNARPAVVFDVLVRLLRNLYPDVRYVSNITDIDDKIIARAREEGVPTDAIAARYEKAYARDMEALGVAPPDIAPRATETLDGIYAFISNLLTAGHAYEAEGHVLFDVASFKGYGALSGRDAEAMRAGARVEVAPYKRDAGDFVLWKPAQEDEPGFDSPWGRGRPGWHIECSAMIKAHLGDAIDIHGGGADLIFPHHENERAQSLCAHPDAPFVRFWVHNALLRMGDEKMSKSRGNIVAIDEACAQHKGEVVRMALLGTHYRQPLVWSDATLAQARDRLDRLYRALDGTDADAGDMPDDVALALCDDLNTPDALGCLMRHAQGLQKEKDAKARARRAAQIRAAGAVLGILNQTPDSWFHAESDAGEIERLIKARDAARAAKDFALSDSLRAQIEAQGVILEDSAAGTRWRKKR